MCFYAGMPLKPLKLFLATCFKFKQLFAIQNKNIAKNCRYLPSLQRLFVSLAADN